MDDIRHAQALITWYRDPSSFSRDEWIRDIVVHYGEIIDRVMHRDTWTVLFRIISQVEGTWDTYADVAFLLTPHLGICGYQVTASICGQERTLPPFTFYDAIFIYFTHTCSTEFPQSPAKMKILSRKR